jgi:hypothetical protein
VKAGIGDRFPERQVLEIREYKTVFQEESSQMIQKEARKRK